ncbi:MAG TPA: 3-oxoacyl-ACP reductase [Planctomycetaceae bacterium]|nr:3-oxoacyl-ACP reductase [Planctomycetaceae bacterium]
MSEQPPAKKPCDKTLVGKKAVVTGSSSGIGRAIAVELAKAGCHVLVHGGSNQAGAEETRQLVEACGVKAHVELADLADISSCDQLVNRAWEWGDGVDVWINNAGADVLTTELSEASFEDKMARLWEVDVLGTIRLARHAGQRMKSQAPSSWKPSIVNVGWDQAEVGMAGDSGEMFATTKGAVMAFTRSLAKSLAPAVRVNCLAPGWIKTAWAEEASEYWQQRAQTESLLRRWGAPEDVARVTRFLVSRDADFLTGQIVAVNGGLSMAADAETS